MAAVVALGTFDGVHLGHQAVVRRAVVEGRRLGLSSVAATFHPHPRSVVRPGTEPALLTPIGVRRELLLGLGVDEVVTIPFTRELSLKTPEEFVREVLVGELDAAGVVVGENFRFGRGAVGDVEALRRLMDGFGGRVWSVGVLEAGGEVSSTRIRRAVAEGRVEEAARLLGRPFTLRGKVVEGDRRGRTIGFPTANLIPEAGVVVPGRGVYAGEAVVGRERFGACINVGIAPTFGRGVPRVEAYILDFDRDIYGWEIDVYFTHRLREEKKFGGVEELVAQLEQDVRQAREIAAARNKS
ncbi:bifunctional riboflavin kinase/FAD synthetase [Rubrobacter taiwanensis]|uniref:bifunctional riboflavin kinase/FAD synthetase n=1 Tax=Rubrobacter taiwanensis TaxID=185139 RepID=UPI001A9E80C6|nr:bifunctional riboflavin kinase/FAD synthetase [Rubrobacter taiwanensis]